MLDPRGNYRLLDANDDEKQDVEEQHKSFQIASFKLNGQLSFLINRATFPIAFILSILTLCYLILPIEFTKNPSNPFVEKMITTNEATQYFQKRILHLDLKGAAPKPEYLFDLLPFFANLHFNAILIEYEDMFPYWDEISILARKNAYNSSIISQICKVANSTGLEVIPLVQTFGHMEFVLKHTEFAVLREDPQWSDTICPSNEQSIWLIRQILKQIRSLHPDAKSIHIGCDEAWHIAKNELCLHRLNTTLKGSIERLKMEHISTIARIAREEFGFTQIYAWNDMFDQTDVSLLKEYNLGNLLTPIVWGYHRDVTTPGYFPYGLFHRYSQVFNEIIFASAYKGANGITQQFMSIGRYMDNLISYRKLYDQQKSFLENRLSGIVLTGWQRYAHNKPLCELLPIGIPTMVMEALYLTNWDKQNPMDKEKMKHLLKCASSTNVDFGFPSYRGHHFPISLETEMITCQFPGADLYKEFETIRFLLWKLWLAQQPKTATLSDPSICMEDADLIEKEYEALKERIKPVIEKYFYEETAREWLNQHKRLSDFRSDDQHMSRADIISSI